jgi:DNA-binding winged helix-turn-helix (wHTH) protein/WD40 repeat protein
VENGRNGRQLHRFRFDNFELDVRERELRKHGLRIRVQEKSFQLLLALIERPGEVISREELQRRLWSGHIVIDFESGLNTAAKRLRIALGDSAGSPRYVETVARAGYRFIGTVESTIEQSELQLKSPLQPSETQLTDPNSPSKPFGRRALSSIVALLVLGGIAVVSIMMVRSPRVSEAKFTQITFNRGQVSSARFTVDGGSVLYTAQWDLNPRTLFLVSTRTRESRRLGFVGSSLASVSSRGELALLTQVGIGPITGSVLSRVPLYGAAPVDAEHNIMAADWSPDGERFALIRATEGMNQLEYPTGHVLYTTSGWMGSIRVSPGGDEIAFIEYPLRHDDAGRVGMIDQNGNHRVLTDLWASTSGLAWHPSKKEIWFTASRDSGTRSVFAVTKDGKMRTVANVPATIALRDIAPNGRVLVSRENRRLEMNALLPGEDAERDISWRDWSRLVEISPDGSLILYDESGSAAAGHYISYVYRAADHNVHRVGEGLAQALSPDLKSVLLLDSDDRTRLRLVSLDGKQSREIPPFGVKYQWARFLPSGKSLLALANEAGGPLRLYRLAFDEVGKPIPLTSPTAIRNVAVSPDGSQVAVLKADGESTIYSTSTGDSVKVLDTRLPLAPILWAGSDTLYVQRQRTFSDLPASVLRMSIKSGNLEVWKDISPHDPIGVNAITRILIATNEKNYAYNTRRVLSELLTVNGWD